MGTFLRPLTFALTWTVQYSKWCRPESAHSAFADISFQPSINHSSKTYVLSQVNTLLKKKKLLQNPTGTFTLAYSSIKSLWRFIKRNLRIKS